MDHLSSLKIEKDEDKYTLKILKLNLPLHPPKLFRTTHRYCQFCNESMPSYKDYERCNYCYRISGKFNISDKSDSIEDEEHKNNKDNNVDDEDHKNNKDK